MKPLLVVITGPTAVGKTSLSLALAKHFSCPIVAADSRQVYKEMSIGTACPSENELSQVPHHFIHSHSIQQNFNAGIFEVECLALLNSLFKENSVVILSGGSGLYINAVLYGSDQLPKANEKIRNDLKQILSENGIEALQIKLQTLDPAYYNEVDLQNPQRLMRAIEVCEIAGVPYSSLRKSTPKQRNFDFIVFAMDEDRELLYQNINQRVDKMMTDGLLEEAKSLLPNKHLNAVQTVGYTELFEYFDGKINLETAIDKIKQHTRNYAKRQLTWLRKHEDVHWVIKSEQEKIIELVNSRLQ